MGTLKGGGGKPWEWGNICKSQCGFVGGLDCDDAVGIKGQWRYQKLQSIGGGHCCPETRM